MSNLKNPTDSSGNSLKVRYRIWHSGVGFQLCAVNLLIVDIGDGENEMMKIKWFTEIRLRFENIQKIMFWI